MSPLAREAWSLYKITHAPRPSMTPVPHPNPILAVCPNPACQAGIDSPELPQACPRCGAVLTEGHA